MLYRKKPVEVEAYHYTGDWEAAMGWASYAPSTGTYLYREGEDLKIHTMEGAMKVSVGDYIICGVKGEYYACKPDIFHETYEPAHIEPI
jgi:hypothetical protein